MTLPDIILRSKIRIENLIALYPYGSRVYGIAHQHSDYDFIAIVKEKTNSQFSDNLININFYTAEEHQQRLDDHEISALECYFLPQAQVLFDTLHPLNRERVVFKFKTDLSKLRVAISAKSSNSWVKAKKKLTVEKDYDLNLGRKSLFHSLRIIEYGKQIAQFGKIVDYAACNTVYFDIKYCSSWEEVFLRYKRRYNSDLSEFRILAPKG